MGEKTKTPGSVSGGKITPLSLVLCWSLLVFRAGPGLCWFSAGVCWFSAGLFTGASLAVTYVGGGLRCLSRPGVAACRGQAIFCPVTVTLARRRAYRRVPVVWPYCVLLCVFYCVFYYVTAKNL